MAEKYIIGSENKAGGWRNGGRPKVEDKRKQVSCKLNSIEQEIYYANGGAETLRALLNAGLFKAPKE